MRIAGLCEITAFLTLASQQASVTGVVRDSLDLEPVAFARVTVAVAGGPAREAVSDRFGAFVVTGAGPGAARVEVRGLGYDAWKRQYAELPTAALRVLMRRSPLALDSIVVETQGRAGNPLSVSPGAFVIDSLLVRTQPAILEMDVLRAAAISPAASAPSDWVSVPYIRGGASHGTPVLLDGVRLFNPFHVGGFLSAFNAEAISRVTLLTGSGGDAQPIGSLSGAIDLATRDGARDRRRIGGSVGLASLRLSVEGPIGQSTSYLVDARRTYIDWFAAGLKQIKVTKRGLPYSFGDVHAKITKDLGGVRRLSFTGYLNGEFLDSRPEDVPEGRGALSRATKADWSNAAVTAHYRDRMGSSTLIDITAGHSRFSGAYIVFADRTRDADTSAVARGRMGEYRAEMRLEHHARSATVNAGVQATRLVADHLGYGTGSDGGDPNDLFQPFNLKPAQTRVSGYANAGVALGQRLSARTGLRVDHFVELETTLAPFAELAYEGSSWDVWVSAVRSHQALSSLRNEESVGSTFLAFDLLVPVRTAPVPRNTQISAGWEGTRGAHHLRLEAYLRKLQNLRLPRLSPNPLESSVLVAPSLREVASGSARGIDASWSWGIRGRANMVGSYRWASASRTVGTNTYVPRFHRDHEAEVGASLERGTSTWSVRFSARSGQPMTPFLALLPFAGYRSPDADVLVITDDVLNLSGEYNSERLPSYLRIDVGWRSSKEVSWFGGGSLVPYFSVANLFSLPNVVGVAPERTQSGTSELVYAPQLPMLPFFGVEFRF